jgi:hypothetical protein
VVKRALTRDVKKDGASVYAALEDRRLQKQWRAIVIRPKLSKDNSYSWMICEDESDRTWFSKDQYATEKAAWNALVKELERRRIIQGKAITQAESA